MSELKQYGMKCYLSGGYPCGLCGPFEYPGAYWVKHEDAAAEIERLRALVRTAYEEGWRAAACASLSTESWCPLDEDWVSSYAAKQLMGEADE